MLLLTAAAGEGTSDHDYSVPALPGRPQAVVSASLHRCPAPFRDAQSSHPDSLVATGEHALGLRADETVLDQLGDDRGAEALGKHQRFGASVPVVSEKR